MAEVKARTTMEQRREVDVEKSIVSGLSLGDSARSWGIV